MSRKRDPNDVLDAFLTELDESLRLWGDIRQHVGVTGEMAKRVSVDAFTRAAVAFEGFRSDWHIAAINRDSTEFKTFLQAKVRGQVRGTTPALVKHVRVDLPKHPTLQEITGLLDPKERNISIPDMAVWRTRANEHLRDPWKAKILAITGADEKLVSAVVLTRNLLAHESVSAADEMNTALRNLSISVDGNLRRGSQRIKPSGIGSYLNAVTGPAPRVEHFHVRLKVIANSMRV